MWECFGLIIRTFGWCHPMWAGFWLGLRPQYQLSFRCCCHRIKTFCSRYADRHQMFTSAIDPHYPQTNQVAAAPTNVRYRAKPLFRAETSQFEDYTEVVVNWANILYPAGNTRCNINSFHWMCIVRWICAHRRKYGVFTPSKARGELGINLISIRWSCVLNYADRDISVNRPSQVRNCANAICREPQSWVGDTKDEPRKYAQGQQVGWLRMANWHWETMIVPARAQAILTKDGKSIEQRRYRHRDWYVNRDDSNCCR